MQTPNLNYLLEVELLFLPMLSLQDWQQRSTYLKTGASDTEQVFRTRLCSLLAHILCPWTISFKKAKQSQPARVSSAQGSPGAGVSGCSRSWGAGRAPVLRAASRGRDPPGPRSTKAPGPAALPGGRRQTRQGPRARQGEPDLLPLGWEGLKGRRDPSFGALLGGTSSGCSWAVSKWLYGMRHLSLCRGKPGIDPRKNLL